MSRSGVDKQLHALYAGTVQYSDKHALEEQSRAD